MRSQHFSHRDFRDFDSLQTTSLWLCRAGLNTAICRRRTDCMGLKWVKVDEKGPSCVGLWAPWAAVRSKKCEPNWTT